MEKINGFGRNNSRVDEKNTDFYYANTYPADEKKAQNMQNNVYRDLKPFTAYIQASIDHIGKSTAEGADIKILSDMQEKHLVPEFSLIKVKLPGVTFMVQKPQNVFVLSADENFDTESFEVFKRKDSICTREDKIDCHDGFVFIRGNADKAPVFSGKQKFDLYDDVNHKDESIKCSICPVDFEKPELYHIGISVDAVRETEKELVFTTSDNISSLTEIELFGDKLPVSKKNSVQKAEVQISGHKVTSIDGDLYVVKPALPADKKKSVLLDGKKAKYNKIELSELPENEVQNLLQTKDVSVRNGRLVYNGDEKDALKFSDFTFTVKSEKLHFKKQLRDKKGKFIGTIIEVLTDSKSIRDLESNTDAFFLETTERLTDELPFCMGKNRSFRVGRKDENQNLLEIAEETENGLVCVDSGTLPSRLFAVPNDWQLKKQQDAITKLTKMPCSEHRGLLELFERKSDGRSFGAKWKTVQPEEVTKWYILTDESYDGCAEQRKFVCKALASGDFSFLDGPPGSGKTTVLLELIVQLVEKGKKVLLTASTNAAVDNILERLNKLSAGIQNKILAVRIGNESSISETVREYSLSDIPDEYQEEIVMRANLVCGTIFGLLKHPAFKLNDRNQPVRPLYDYLIIDEASKTTFQDFLIPALYSKHWVLSGDLKQLTPYVEQETIQSSIEEIPEFDRNMQRIQTLLCLAKENRISQKNMRFYLVVSKKQILSAEQLVTNADDLIGVITKEKSNNPLVVSVQEIKDAEQKSVILYGAKFLLIDESVVSELKNLLPADCVPMYDVAHDEHYADLFLAASAERYFSLKKPTVELGSCRDKSTFKSWQNIADYWTKAAKEHSWAQEITWRLCRIQELFLESKNNKTVEHYKREIAALMPSSVEKADKIKEYCDELSGIALPSILQLLQNGLDKEIIKNKKKTTLNTGFDRSDFDQRHTMLTYQHRMEPSISVFSAEHVYNGEALKDGSEMKEKRNWNCSIFGNSHDVWLDTTERMKELHDCTNENQTEVRIIKDKIRAFMQWTKDNPNPDKDSRGIWSVACLSYYKKQERNLKQAVKDLFGELREKSHYEDAENHIEVFIYTVDKFQGREADVVFLSLIKSRGAPLGFMDSPNRLNVALTRARFQRVIVGCIDYFRNTRKSELLKELAAEAKIVEGVK